MRPAVLDPPVQFLLLISGMWGLLRMTSLLYSAGGWSALRWQFYLGIALAAIGGCLVTLYKPPPSKTPAAVVSDSK